MCGGFWVLMSLLLLVFFRFPDDFGAKRAGQRAMVGRNMQERKKRRF